MCYNLKISLVNRFHYLCILLLVSNVNCLVLSTLSRPKIAEGEPCDTGHTKDLRTLTYIQLQNFFNSFDIVMTDIDGVLWHGITPNEVAIDKLKFLANRHKEIILVTNNSLFPKEYYINVLENLEYTISPDNIILPSTTLLWYLKSNGFHGKAFVIGSKDFKKSLQVNGMNIISGLECIEEDIHLLDNITTIDKDVKAVIVEFDVNVNWPKIAQAGLYLQNKDVLFLAGASDKRLPVSSESKIIIGPGLFQDILVNHTGRTPTLFSKPGNIVKDFFNEHYHPLNPERVLFIGDSLDIDMKFADLNGFTKLWVGSGVDGKDLCNFTAHCDIVPDYYLPDLSEMPSIDCTTE